MGKNKKISSGLGNSAGKVHTFHIPQLEFPDLAEIDRCVCPTNSSTHLDACSVEGGPGGVRDPPYGGVH
jgi:hypothetical protein